MFLNGVKNNWVLMEVDLPKDESKLSKETLKQNNLLKDYFEITGFPTALALSQDGDVLGTISRTSEPESFLKRLNFYLEINTNYTKHINEASTLEGEAQAIALTKALNIVSKDKLRFHTESLNELKKLTDKGLAKDASQLLAHVKQVKETIEEDARQRTLDSESEFVKAGKIGWMTDLEAAKAKAKKEGKYLFIHFVEPTTSAPKVMKNQVYYQPQFKEETAKDWVLVELHHAFMNVKEKTPEYEKNKIIYDRYGATRYFTVSSCAFSDGRPFSLNHYWTRGSSGLDKFLEYMEAKKKEGDDFKEKLNLAQSSIGKERAIALDEFLYPHFEYRLERPSGFDEQYAPEIKLLLEADTEANQKSTKLAIINPIFEEIDFKMRAKKITLEVSTPLWIKIGNLATRYLEEHDTSKFPQLRSRLYRIQALGYAHQGDKEKSDQALNILLSKEMAGTRGRHTLYRNEKNVGHLKNHMKEALEFSKQ